jgi:hypothetical protein
MSTSYTNVTDTFLSYTLSHYTSARQPYVQTMDSMIYVLNMFIQYTNIYNFNTTMLK